MIQYENAHPEIRQHPDQSNQPSEQEKIVLTRQVYEGILPPPEMLKAYEKIHEGAAREIFDLVKEQQAHLRWMDRQGVRESFIQLILSFALGLLAQIGTMAITLSGFYMAYIYIEAGEPKLGYAVASVFTIICGYLVWWKTRNVKETQ